MDPQQQQQLHVNFHRNWIDHSNTFQFLVPRVSFSNPFNQEAPRKGQCELTVTWIGRCMCDPWRLVTTIRGGKPRGKPEGKTMAEKSNTNGDKATPFEKNELNWV